MDIKEFINKQNWIVAKTYVNKAPHEYCLLRRVFGTEKDFRDAVRYIKENGITMYWYKSERRYLLLDGKMYWTMEDNPDDSILINRCNIDDYNIFKDKNSDRLYVSWKGPKK